MKRSKLRILVVDSSSYQREALRTLLAEVDDLELVASARDAEGGLHEAASCRPELVLLGLDLGAEGFSFLRRLGSMLAVPVIVLSNRAKQQEVFKALELGAFDFVTSHETGPRRVELLRDELLPKIRQAQLLHPLQRRPAMPAPNAPLHVVLIGASTGGPPLVSRLLAALPADFSAAVVVLQHMPARITSAFAERLRRLAAIEVLEGVDGHVLAPGEAIIAPGGQNLEFLEVEGQTRLCVREPARGDRFLPSIDKAFSSAARLFGPRCLAVVLTGMGNDGTRGALAIRAAGGRVLVESAETAVIYGMPKEVTEAGGADRVLRQEEIFAELLRFGG